MLSDHLSAPVGLLQNQVFTEQPRRSPFGKVSHQSQTSEFNLGLPGQYHDSESGLR